MWAVFQTRFNASQEDIMRALARRLGWWVRRPVHKKVAGLMLSLGCGFDPWLGHIRQATDRCFSDIDSKKKKSTLSGI